MFFGDYLLDFDWLQQLALVAPVFDGFATPKRVRSQSSPGTFPQTFNPETFHASNDQGLSASVNISISQGMRYGIQELTPVPAHADAMVNAAQKFIALSPMTGSISNADFWLVMSVEVIDTDVVKETLKAHFFTKWYLHMPNFVDRVKRGQAKTEMEWCFSHTGNERERRQARRRVYLEVLGPSIRTRTAFGWP